MELKDRKTVGNRSKAAWNFAARTMCANAPRLTSSMSSGKPIPMRATASMFAWRFAANVDTDTSCTSPITRGARTFAGSLSRHSIPFH